MEERANDEDKTRFFLGGPKIMGSARKKMKAGRVLGGKREKTWERRGVLGIACENSVKSGRCVERWKKGVRAHEMRGSSTEDCEATR